MGGFFLPFGGGENPPINPSFTINQRVNWKKEKKKKVELSDLKERRKCSLKAVKRLIHKVDDTSRRNPKPFLPPTYPLNEKMAASALGAVCTSFGLFPLSHKNLAQVSILLYPFPGHPALFPNHFPVIVPHMPVSPLPRWIQLRSLLNKVPPFAS